MESRSCRKLGVGVFHTRRVETVRYSQVHKELRLAWSISDLGYNEVNYLINFKRIPKLLCGLLGTEEVSKALAHAWHTSQLPILFPKLTRHQPALPA